MFGENFFLTARHALIVDNLEIAYKKSGKFRIPSKLSYDGNNILVNILTIFHTAGFSSYDGEFRLPLVLAQAGPIFPSS